MVKSKASITALMMILSGEAAAAAGDFYIRVQGPDAQGAAEAVLSSSKANPPPYEIYEADEGASSALKEPSGQSQSSQGQNQAGTGAPGFVAVSADKAASFMSDAGDNVQEPAQNAETEDVLFFTQPLSDSFDEAVFEGYRTLCSQRSLGAYVPSGRDEAVQSLKDYAIDSGRINLVFDKAMVDQNIKSQGNAVFTGFEDPILVWITTLQDGRNVLVGADNLTPYAGQLIETAGRDFNYRLMFPLLDLEDVQKVSPNTILSHNDKVLSQAAKRYGSKYFLTLAVSEQGNFGSVKWNLYSADASHISGSEISGLSEELAALAAGDIARSLAALDALQKGLSPKEQGALLVSQSNVFELGAGDGFVRVKIDNVQSLYDLHAMRSAIISYGYSSDVRIGGSDDGALIVEIPTSSDPAILDGTMARAGKFTKLGPWHYALNNGTKQSPSQVRMGPPSPGRPDAAVQIMTNVPQGAEVSL